MKGLKTSSTGQGPQSGAGIMSMFGVSGGGPKVKVIVFVGVCIGFILIELILNMIA